MGAPGPGPNRYSYGHNYQERSRKQFSPRLKLCEHRANMFKHLQRSTKQFSLPWRCCVARADSFLCGNGERKHFLPRWKNCGGCIGFFKYRKVLESSFHHSESPVKLVQASLSTKKDLETFDHNGSLVTLVQTCSTSWKDQQSNFPYCRGTVNHVLTCFITEMVGESSFDSGGSIHCGARIGLFK